jgi:hypothetical protein
MSPENGDQASPAFYRMRSSNYHHFISGSRHIGPLCWVLALVFASIAGYTHVRIDATGLSVLMVTGFTMFLSYRRPEGVWWWAAIIGLSLPAAVLLSYLTRQKPSLGLVAASFAGLAFSIVAAVGGKFLRRVVADLFPPKSSQRPPNN